jgi:hypothetical protein
MGGDRDCPEPVLPSVLHQQFRRRALAQLSEDTTSSATSPSGTTDLGVSPESHSYERRFRRAKRGGERYSCHRAGN